MKKSAAKTTTSDIVVYEFDRSQKLQVRTDGETVWLSIDQMAELFGRDRSVVGKHVRNVFKEGELVKSSVWANSAYTASDGKTYRVDFYNLDVVISVGYRVKSLQGTRFRQWATKMLREMLMRRLEETKSIAKLTQRVSKVEADVEQIKGGMNYLVRQLSAPQDPPRRRIGFGADNAETPTKPYGKLSISGQT